MNHHPLRLLSILTFISLLRLARAFSNYYNPDLPIGATKNVATQILQGVGPCSADTLNRYNLEDLEQIASEWTANFVRKVTAIQPKLQLGVQNSKELFVDTVTVTYPRSSSGLGIVLQELAGGRSDGLGITIISDVVQGSEAEKMNGIEKGDSIARISVVRTIKKEKNEETQKIFSVATECLGYDATVQALHELPLQTAEQSDSWQVTLKRVRRKPVVTVNLQYPPSQVDQEDVSFQLFAGENLRQAMLVRGVKLNDELAQRYDGKTAGGNCGAGGLCRTCSVIVTKGGDLLNPQRMNEKTMFQNQPRWRLACKAIVGYGMKEGELTIRVNPSQW